MNEWNHRTTLHMKCLHLIYYPLLLFLISIPSGCASSLKVQTATISPPGEATKVAVEDTAPKTWEEGMEAFERGDYSHAGGLFEILSEKSPNEKIRNRALYALAVTRLIQAESPDEFSRAMQIWERWSEQHPTDIEGEDPRMLTPFLERLVPPGTQQASTAPPKPPRNVERTNIYNSYLVCKELLRTRDKEVGRMKAALDLKEKEIRKLKKQITSLEEIHLKFQEKKQETSSP